MFESEHFKKQAGLLTFLETHNAQMIREGKKEEPPYDQRRMVPAAF